jgi:pyruvate kinase
MSAVALARRTNATALAAFTRSGHTAQLLSKLHPPMPVFALCGTEAMARQLVLWRGVAPLVREGVERDVDFVRGIERELQRAGLLAAGGSIVLVGAAPDSPPGQTNFIRILRLNAPKD